MEGQGTRELATSYLTTCALCLAAPTFPRHKIEKAVAERARDAGDLPAAAQVHHMLQMSVRPYINLRIVPFSAGAHAGMADSFELMRFNRIEPVIFLEGEKSNLIVERKDAADDYEEIVKALDRIALDKEDSRKLLAKLAA